MTLKEWRRRAGLSQAQAAELFGILGADRARNVSRYETGEREPPLWLVSVIMRKTQGLVTVDDLLSPVLSTKRAA